MKKIIFFLINILLGLNSSAQIKYNNSTYFRAVLREGSIYQGFSNLNKIAVSTSYGNLSIPVSTLTSIKFKLEFDTLKAISLMQDLKSSKNRLSQQVIDALIKKNSLNLYYSVKKMMSENENDTTEILNENLSNLNNQFVETFPNLNESIKSDYIDNGTDFIDFPCKIDKRSINSIYLKTSFGEINIPIYEIASLEINNRKGGNSETNLEGYKKITLFANKNIYGNKNKEEAWLNTNIDIKEGDSILIVAKGKIVLQSLGGNSYLPNGKKINTISSAPESSNDNYTPSYGKVIFKIDKSLSSSKSKQLQAKNTAEDDIEIDEVYKNAGDKYGDIADKSGTLFLSIYETIFKNTNSGSYSVYIKIIAKKK